MKTTSVGILITNGKTYLACHSTGNSFYDLPKGLQEAGEEPVHTCCRETEEETGIVLNPDNLTDLGVYPYLRTKDLHLFMWLTDKLPGTDQLDCRSFFVHPRSGRNVPEVDGYRYVAFADTDTYMSKSMARVIRRLGDEGMPPADQL